MLFGLVALIGLIAMLNADKITGKATQGPCPEGFFWQDDYCVQDECRHVKCVKDGNFIKVPDCACMTYLGKMLCGIKGSEKTAIKTDLCKRHGQIDLVCGWYNSTLGYCVANPELV